MQRRDKPPPDFVDGDKTILVPTPGRRRGGSAADEASLDQTLGKYAAASDDRQRPIEAPAGIGINPLLRAAAPLLALAYHLRTARGHQDVSELRGRVMAAICQFEEDVRRMGISTQTAKQTQYALCALIDEMVLSTPWGFESNWSTEPLQITLFGKGKSGEGFYAILKDALSYPSGNIDALELYYVCLSLGYKGLYGRDQDGMARLNELKQRVYREISRERGEPVDDLSPRWKGVVERRPAVSRFLAWWVVPIVVLTVVILTYVGLSYSINQESDEVFTRVSNLETPEVVTPPEPPPPPLPQPVVELPPPPLPPSLVEDLRLTLQPEIDKGLLAVEDRGTTARIILYNKGLFPSGQAEVGESFRSVIEKIALVLVQDDPPGPYVISGHTDNVPIRTLRFPSNYHLSKARADSVVALLQKHLTDPDRLQSEGRADREPIGSNDTAEGQALNRRVEIEVPIPVN
jgi:type VI secretion system protein ImpK